ncbi:hypothetical protein JOD20_004887 [Herpetosiphon giganteus]|nr:hypothetical protein [Herpetosiphon giganteus]
MVASRALCSCRGLHCHPLQTHSSRCNNVTPATISLSLTLVGEKNNGVGWKNANSPLVGA